MSSVLTEPSLRVKKKPSRTLRGRTQNILVLLSHLEASQVELCGLRDWHTVTFGSRHSGWARVRGEQQSMGRHFSITPVEQAARWAGSECDSLSTSVNTCGVGGVHMYVCTSAWLRSAANSSVSHQANSIYSEETLLSEWQETFLSRKTWKPPDLTGSQYAKGEMETR